jgi:hypothetical protein
MDNEIYYVVFVSFVFFGTFILYAYLKKGNVSTRLIWKVLILPFRILLGFFFDLKKIRTEFNKGYTTISKDLNLIKKPEDTSFEKGAKFEKFIEDKFFPKEHYNLVEKTHSYETNNERYVESSMNPDYQFRDIKEKKTFWVEAKFKSHFTKGKVEWCASINQLSRYRKSSKKMPLFLILGMGGSPDNPKYVSLIPLTGKFLKYRHLYFKEVESHTIDISKHVSSLDLWK